MDQGTSVPFHDRHSRKGVDAMQKKIKNYSYWRIVRILHKDYNIVLKKRWQGYKANRKKGYKERYDLILEEDNSIILENISLNGLRYVLTQEGYPLYDERSKIR